MTLVQLVAVKDIVGWTTTKHREVQATRIIIGLYYVNPLRSRQNGHLFADDTFKRVFLNKNIRISTNFTEVCSLGFYQQYSSIGSDNGLASTRRQAIIWTNAG